MNFRCLNLGKKAAAFLTAVILMAGSLSWAAAEESYRIAQDFALPARYDMREAGVVTPVKLQYPWMDCWAFAGIAAAETSILSSMGTTYEQFPLDLSEKHAMWFLAHPISEKDDPRQAGEGPIPSEIQNPGMPAEICFASRNAFYIAEAFASGAGPVEEHLFPYMGKTGMLELDLALKDPETWKEHYLQKKAYNSMRLVRYLPDDAEEAYESGTLDPAVLEKAEADMKAATQKIAEAALQEKLQQIATGYYLQYDIGDDWSIPETDQEGNSNRIRNPHFILTDSNVMPVFSTKDDKGTVVLSATGMYAAKQEMLNGHGVAATYSAESYSPEKENPNLYTNFETGAIYSYDEMPEGSSHAICIVGWDDNYPAENFTHEVFVTDENGNRVSDPERTAKTTPPGNGAWLIKNTRGSETDAVMDGMVSTVDGKTYPANYSQYGIPNEEGKHTGYNWISYYDTQISPWITMSFDTSETGDQTKALQYDYLSFKPEIALRSSYIEKSDKPVPMANVFSAEEDTELCAVAIHTLEANSRVTYSVYRLGENAKDPEDGELAERISVNHPYAGYHRVSLAKPVSLKKGERFSVIASISHVEDDGRITYVRLAAAGRTNEDTVIVNPGESFLTLDGKWTDLAEVRDQTVILDKISMHSEENDCKADNFPIKAFVKAIK